LNKQVSTWFHVTDMTGILNKLHNITSQSINYTNKDLDDLIEKLNLSDCLEYKTNTTINEIAEEKERSQQAIIKISLPQNLETNKKEI